MPFSQIQYIFTKKGFVTPWWLYRLGVAFSKGSAWKYWKYNWCLGIFKVEYSSRLVIGTTLQFNEIFLLLLQIIPPWDVVGETKIVSNYILHSCMYLQREHSHMTSDF